MVSGSKIRLDRAFLNARQAWAISSNRKIMREGTLTSSGFDRTRSPAT
jgi:hypothetical protein